MLNALRAGLVLLVAGLLPLAPASGRQETAESPAPGYRAPVLVDGRAFPVLRSTWFSVINFSNDWHAPRMRKIGGRWRQIGVHEGTDVFAEPGTPIAAVTGGTVERMGWLFYSGWRVGIRDDAGRYWFYAHLSSYDPTLAEGRRVEAGQIIGRVGNTGYGTTPGHRDEFVPHLHLGIQEPNGEWINPHPLLVSLYKGTVTRH